jgi:hypothetical protein
VESIPTDRKVFKPLSKLQDAGYHRHHREEEATMVWRSHKDAEGENTKFNYGMDTTGEKEKRTSKKNMD